MYGGVLARFFCKIPTGIYTIKERGGYGGLGSATVHLLGPGTLHVTHLDIQPSRDFLEIPDSQNHMVFLTGNYSSCLRSGGLESVYTDKNLAPATHLYSIVPGGDYHTTEETQLKQGDLCHDVLTGKLLLPAPVDVPAEGRTLRWYSDGSSDGGEGNEGADGPSHDSVDDFFEGYELKYQLEDTAIEDVSCPSGTLSLGITTKDDPTPVFQAVGVENLSTGGKKSVQQAPDSVPLGLYFRDEDPRHLRIRGKVYVKPGITERALHHNGTRLIDSAPLPHSYTITLEKFSPKGHWGFNLGAESVVFGPRDNYDGEPDALMARYYPDQEGTFVHASVHCPLNVKRPHSP